MSKQVLELQEIFPQLIVLKDDSMHIPATKKLAIEGILSELHLYYSSKWLLKDFYLITLSKLIAKAI